MKNQSKNPLSLNKEAIIKSICFIHYFTKIITACAPEISIIRYLLVLSGIFLLGLSSIVAQNKEQKIVQLGKKHADMRHFFINKNGESLADTVWTDYEFHSCFTSLKKESSGRLLVFPKGFTIAGDNSINLDVMKGSKKSKMSFFFIRVERTDTICFGLVADSQYKINENEIYLETEGWTNVLLPFLMPGQSLNRMIFTFGLIFALLFLAFLNFSSYILVGRTDYLYYSIYTLLILFYFGVRFILVPILEINQLENTTMLGMFNTSIQPLFYVMYSLFSRSFLETSKKYGFLDGILRFFIYLSILGSLLIIVLFIPFNKAAYFVFDAYRIIAIGMAIWMIIYLISTKDKLGFFIATGTIFLVLGAGIAMMVSSTNKYLFGLYPLAYMKIGIMLEFLFFSLGMARKTSMLNEEKIEAQNKLFQAQRLLSINEEEKNKILENELALARKTLVIEEKERLKVHHKLKMTELEMEGLINQLNPHFVFNSLNSLKWHVLKNNTSNAVYFIDQLSTLIRNFHSFTKRQYVTLGELLENIKLYVDLENLRMSKLIKLDIIIDPGIDPDFEEILPLIVQPFVENAIWHGLSSSEIVDPGVSINITSDDNFLKINITDNGIGRKSSALKAGNSNNMGIATELIKRRLEIHNKEDNGLEITDLYHDNGTPAGTSVNIRIRKIS